VHRPMRTMRWGRHEETNSSENTDNARRVATNTPACLRRPQITAPVKPSRSRSAAGLDFGNPAAVSESTGTVQLVSSRLAGGGPAGGRAQDPAPGPSPAPNGPTICQRLVRAASGRRWRSRVGLGTAPLGSGRVGAGPRAAAGGVPPGRGRGGGEVSVRPPVVPGGTRPDHRLTPREGATSSATPSTVTEFATRSGSTRFGGS
jgi:hypothetical protein